MTCQFREGNENRRSVPWSLPSLSRRRPFPFPAGVLPLDPRRGLARRPIIAPPLFNFSRSNLSLI